MEIENEGASLDYYKTRTHNGTYIICAETIEKAHDYAWRETFPKDIKSSKSKIKIDPVTDEYLEQHGFTRPAIKEDEGSIPAERIQPITLDLTNLREWNQTSLLTKIMERSGLRITIKNNPPTKKKYKKKENRIRIRDTKNNGVFYTGTIIHTPYGMELKLGPIARLYFKTIGNENHTHTLLKNSMDNANTEWDKFITIENTARITEQKTRISAIERVPYFRNGAIVGAISTETLARLEKVCKETGADENTALADHDKRIAPSTSLIYSTTNSKIQTEEFTIEFSGDKKDSAKIQTIRKEFNRSLRIEERLRIDTAIKKINWDKIIRETNQICQGVKIKNPLGTKTISNLIKDADLINCSHPGLQETKRTFLINETIKKQKALLINKQLQKNI